ncbi:sigma-54-dependent transcriptional regulator [Thiorhodovibrio frisius]|uniref:Response regulator with CheY-like receiver, AAA-type ATPase, and DNA-binding domains n=1 Tax=Thiorhodovibrio frisius TaxID=631362 RepID=H8Z477_9GAMM|nr:sigma 54-interacting transcriptional regulator [Thiorhodovibrio frisius]EIC20134.1 response regulator with CheY-like receiver, AAA-type ATPase, and DNA-binding domains [Thiorhodovibrio frisius]WPL20870.1 Transcriptional regulatory protein ZraR [Thiorhodovibrio frisius]
MPNSRRLTPAERDFFALLTETVYANPFGSDPARLSRLLGRDLPSDAISQADHYSELMPAIDQRFAVLRERGLERLDHFAGEDQELMRLVFLFVGYQRHLGLFDQLIEQQSGAPDLRWLPELLASLRDQGFEPAEVRRWVALYYQLRRAYFFIERAMVGRSAPMQRLRRALWNSVFTSDLRGYTLLLWERMQDFSTLLLGETGTGKGSAAAAIGRSGAIPLTADERGFSHGLDQTFIATNLSELSESLIESELFGHRKGAFTGAVDHHDGLFARCDAWGTLFLDEIGDVSLPVQTKLLRVLQERTFAPVGSHQTKRFAGRVVAATNRPLSELTAGQGFRRDFFYRLSGNIIEMPSLRERLADCPDELSELAGALLGRMLGESAASLHARIMEALDELPTDYPWPGNVRELEQALRRIILNGRYVPDALPDETGGFAHPDPWLTAAKAGSLDAAALLAGYCSRLYDQLGTFEAVAAVTRLDRRTVKKHVEGAATPDASRLDVIEQSARRSLSSK